MVLEVQLLKTINYKIDSGFVKLRRKRLIRTNELMN